MKLGVSALLKRTFQEAHGRSMYRFLLYLTGLPLHILVYLFYLLKKKDRTYEATMADVQRELSDEGLKSRYYKEYEGQLLRKAAFFQEKNSPDEIQPSGGKVGDRTVSGRGCATYG